MQQQIYSVFTVLTEDVNSLGNAVLDYVVGLEMVCGWCGAGDHLSYGGVDWSVGLTQRVRLPGTL